MPESTSVLPSPQGCVGASQVAQWWRICLPVQETQETWVWSLDREDHLEKEMATRSSILAQKNSMDRGAWRATVHGVSKSWTQLHTHAHRAVSSETLILHQNAGKGQLFGDLYQPVLESLVIILSSSSPWSSIGWSWELCAISMPFLLTGVFILLLLPHSETLRQSDISDYIPQLVISSLGSCHVCMKMHQVFFKASAHPLLPGLNHTNILFCFFFNLFVIGGKSLYNVVLVPAIQQYESAISIHVLLQMSCLNAYTCLSPYTYILG